MEGHRTPSCEPREPAEESLKDMEVIDEYIADPESDDHNDDKEPVEKELPSCGPQDPPEKEQTSCEPQDPAEKEQPSCRPQDPPEEQQPSHGLLNEEVEVNGVTAVEIKEVPIAVINNETALVNMEKDQDQSQDGMPSEGADILRDAESPSRSQSPSDSTQILDSVSQCSVTSAADLNQKVRDKLAKKRCHSSSPDECKRPKKRRHSSSLDEDKRPKKRRHSSSSDEDKRSSNYAELLTIMLNKRPHIAEPIHDYFYGKMYLINKCGISGRKAVDCILHGLGDHPIRDRAAAKQFRHPDDLLEYFKTAKINKNYQNKVVKRDKINQNYEEKVVKKEKIISCYNCGERGHQVSTCPKPIKKCDNCFKFGHFSDTCISKGSKPEEIIKKKCKNCGDTDHPIFRCPNPLKKCGVCSKHGHTSKTCLADSNVIQKHKIIVCFNCKQPGHKTFVCRKPLNKCNFCFKLGHLTEMCNQREPCLNCNEVGHKTVRCKNPKREYNAGETFGKNDNYIPVKVSESDSGSVVQKTEEKKTPSPWIWS